MIWIVCLVVLLLGFTVFFGAPYVPSKKGDVRQAFSELYPLSAEDVLVDIGSGDGVVLRLAAERGARAIGYEINPVLVVLSRWLSRSYPGVTVHQANFWRAKLPLETTIIYTFGDSRDIAKMTEKVQNTATEVNRPIAFISYAFEAPGFTAEKQIGAHYLYRIEPLQVTRA